MMASVQLGHSVHDSAVSDIKMSAVV